MLENMLLAHSPSADSSKYDAFVAWAASYPLILINYTTGSVPYGTTAANSPRSRMIVPTTTSGTCSGSSWGALSGLYGGLMFGALLHAFPDLDTKTENVASGRTVVFTHRYTGSGGAQGGFTRNGFTTTSSTNAGKFAMDEFIYYDKVQDKIMRSVPFSSGASVEFTF